MNNERQKCGRLSEMENSPFERITCTFIHVNVFPFRQPGQRLIAHLRVNLCILPPAHNFVETVYKLSQTLFGVPKVSHAYIRAPYM